MSAHRASTASTATRKTVKTHTPAKTAGRPLRRRTAKANANPITPDERYQLIAEAAYFIAERRGFAPGSELEDWSEAEAEIARRLGEISAS
jgi:hypothetical protein